MATTNANKLKALYHSLAPGAPLTSEDLAELGISADLAVHYVRAGWLTRLARGVYAKPGDQLAVRPSLVVLQRRLLGLHVGGKSALDWYGIRHYVAQRPNLHLCGWSAATIPPWFRERFPVEYHRKRLFSEEPAQSLFVRPFENRAGQPNVSEPERGVLELLSEVSSRQPLEEAREILDLTHTLRAGTLQELLQRCTSVKTVRLCLQLGRELSLPWVNKLDPDTLPKGSNKAWVTRTPNGMLVLK